ncbi:TetR/AcrR family transcriptional regulator [Flavobacterium sedimenticola]|uniref:TetR/AcrR family transcriptional regulator n=1 Tax=Flavobacterium sedimenticola TaxID=3043286 RepID=A0ABT6XNW2_9FLAO|nr:TetR/AcrR family transcriptional regulator [Flavobacterium sedimenticola]MDI9256778.1 TetR/AcrR family transcriptional regulator [Flavobacterium sedimenticola]
MRNKYIESGRSKQKYHTREKILSAAQQLLQSKTDFTLEEVAQNAKLSRATVYRYYSNSDALSAEAVLDRLTKDSSSIAKDIKGDDVLSRCLEIQHYYNNLALDNEAAFRKYLSIVLTNTSEVEQVRGGRRVETLKATLENSNPNLTTKDKTNLIHAASILMGIEAFIVTKDVCGLDNENSKATLKWAMEMMIKGVLKADK